MDLRAASTAALLGGRSTAYLFTCDYWHLALRTVPHSRSTVARRLSVTAILPAARPATRISPGDIFIAPA